MATPMRWSELLAEGRAPLTVGIVLVELVAAIEWLVVIAIMPAVKRDLGGLEFYGLVFSGYSLAALAATPIAGRAADRHGPARPFLTMAGFFILGTLLSGLAISMPMLAAARIVQGYGAGGLYTVVFAAIARTYPESGRARVFALLSAAWVVPGLFGPSYGALLATTVGWRWAFISILPVALIALFLTVPSLTKISGDAALPRDLSMRWPVQLAVGLGIALTGFSVVSPLTLPALALGILLTWPSLRRILPGGSFTARPGQPALLAAIFLLNVGFFGGDYFVPLLITDVRNQSLAVAGIVITLGTISWAAGSWWQTRAIRRIPHSILVTVGALLVSLGIAGVVVATVVVQLWLPYVAWTVAGFGMGIAYPTLYLITMGLAPAGNEGTVVGSAQTAERLALAVGGGLGGAAIALAQADHAPLALGLGAAFVFALVASLLTVAVAGRFSPPA